MLLSAFFWTLWRVSRFPPERSGRTGSVSGARMQAAFLVWSIASASIALSRGTGDIIGMRMVLGVAESIGPLASLTFIRNHFQGERPGVADIALYRGPEIGPALGALVGSALLDRFGWRMMFAVTGLGALIWLPGWLFAMPKGAEKAVDEQDIRACSMFIPTGVTPTANKVHIFFAANSVEGDVSNAVTCHALRAAVASSDWILIAVTGSAGTIVTGAEVLDFLVTRGRPKRVDKLRLSCHSRGKGNFVTALTSGKLVAKTGAARSSPDL